MKLAILSDLHLRYSQDNTRWDDTVRVLNHVVDSMIEHEVDAVLIGGDLFDSHNPHVHAINTCADALRRLTESNPSRRIVIATGNHDMCKTLGVSDGLSVIEYVCGQAVEVCSKPKIVRLGRVQVIVLPYPNKNVMLSKEEYKSLSWQEANQVMHDLYVVILQELASHLVPGCPTILLAHMALSTAVAGKRNDMMQGRDVCLSVHDIPANIDQCFFGHIHKPQELHVSEDEDKVVAVVGSMEADDIAEEGERKRWLLLDTDTGETTSFPTGAREFLTVDIDARGLTGEVDYPYVWEVKDKMVRVKVRLERNQAFDMGAVRRYLESEGAHSVKTEPVYDDDSRVMLSEWNESQAVTAEDLLAEYCKAKGIGGETAQVLVADGIQALETAKMEVSNA